MRKDYIVSSGDESAEPLDHIEKHWSKIWQAAGGPKRNIEGTARRQEYGVIQKYMQQLPMDAKILDGGCGLGDWTIFFHEQGYSVTGIDISRVTIHQLQKMFPDISFDVADLRQSGFDTASIDCYFSWGVFEHFEEGMQPCLQEGFRILKPGGLIFLSVPFDNGRHTLRALFGRYSHLSANQNTRFYQWRFTREELMIELHRQGFEVLTVRAIHKRTGVIRSLYHEFGLPPGWRLTRMLSYALAPLVPAAVFAHMLLAVARKPK